MDCSVMLIVLLLFSSCSWALNGSSGEDSYNHSLVIGLTRISLLQRLQTTEDSLEVLRLTRYRSYTRFHALRRSGGDQHLMDIREPLRIYEDGYIMPLRLGTPPQLFQVYMDTGSDLVWVPCLQTSNTTFFECIRCEDSIASNKIDTFCPLYSLSSRTESCNSPLCVDIHNSDNAYDPCTMAGCSLSVLLNGTCPSSCPPFSYKYGDGIVSGALMRERLSLKGINKRKITMANFCFGCAGVSLNEPVGIAGFGRGILSFPSQLRAMSHRVFSYCLVSYRFEDSSNVSSPLVVGESAITDGDHGVQYTSMINNPMYPNYYYIGLQGISIDDTRLDLPLALQGFDSEGNGGMIIDSGTTYTHLPNTLYRNILSILEATIQYPRCQECEKRTGFDLCYQVPSTQRYQGFPTLSYHFNNNVTFILPTENHFYTVLDSSLSSANNTFNVFCLMLQSIEDGGDGPAAVLGNFQQQNFLVVYDMEKMRIGFEAKDCAASASAKGLYQNNNNI